MSRRRISGMAVALAAVLGCFSERVPLGMETEGLCEGTVPPNVVVIRDFQFEPATLSVPAGTEVTWVNCGAIAHTATSSTAVWNSGIVVTNASFRRVFGSAGSFPYFCEPHPFMTGTITVQ